ncbi:MAG: phosphoribosylaminoimidazole-succinocarboxamide synthase [Bacteroidetes bacterium OLB12]|nr:MAG: phosphoribosylaminoimidazole-succinocarboxamide synthase [Bacteroidetes bacterium OLB12]
MRSIKETHFNFKGQTGFYRGKVRDVYYFGDTMAMVATDRISAFDVILPEAIPDKGRVLNQIAAKTWRQPSTWYPTGLLARPTPM